MERTLNSKNRKQIWLALSTLYLDTELQPYDFENMAKMIKKSPYTLAEVKNINKYEVFPILQPNLLSVAGVWEGFDEKWLITSIQNNIQQRNLFKKLLIEIFYFFFKGMNKGCWREIEKAYYQNVNNRN